jgi:hypothetical protein
MFHHVELTGLLNPDCNIDLFILHLVSKPIIQHRLGLFRSGWAYHSMRTEHGKTSLKLWILGMHSLTVQEDALILNGLEVFTLNLLSLKITSMHELQ